VTSETTLLFHAAAGGVGLIAGQWAKHLGATSIGTAGSDEKCALALEHGHAHCINYSTHNFARGGRAHHRWPQMRRCLRRRGQVDLRGIARLSQASLACLSSYGNASGPIDAFNLSVLSQKGSLYVTRPTIFTYIATRAMLEETANDLLDVVTSGAVSIPVSQRFALSDVVEAHKALEARKTTGATVLLPNG
jgi:NADPH2:quinone reductase